jgi:hypothetical protein
MECSLSALDEPLAATASLANAYVIIEQPGPWGHDAIHDSHLPAAVADHLTTAQGTGTKVLLARHAHRPERAHDGTRHLWIGFTAPGSVRMRHTANATDDEILSLDFSAIAANALPPIGDKTDAGVIFVCTHSGRDRCCAVHGRALVNALTDHVPEPDSVWECSHLGGHRFAPTALVMPAGIVYGRLDLPSALAITTHMNERLVDLDHCRGRSAFAAPLQAADIAVRKHAQILDADALDVLWVRDGRAVPVPPGVALDMIASALTEVRHHDGRAWRVSVRHIPLTQPRQESCGKEPHDGLTWVAGEVEAMEPWRR